MGRQAEAEPYFEDAYGHFEEALKLGRESHLLTTMANWHLRRYQRHKDPADLDHAERLAEEGGARLVQADVNFRRGPAYLARAIEHYEAAVGEMIQEARQSAYAEQKLTTPPGLQVVERMAKCYLDHGRAQLTAGDAAAALRTFSKPRLPWRGPGTTPLHELYAWPIGGTSRWFALELHRLWMLAAQSGVRDPRQALGELDRLWAIASPRLRRGGLNASQLGAVELLFMDIRAAALAGAGEFSEAVKIAGSAAGDG